MSSTMTDSERKKRKLDTSCDALGKQKLQCEYILPKKQRRCALQRRADNKYCAEHMQTQESTRKRVPCPKGPRHTVWENEVEKHVKKCNANKNPYDVGVWYKENCNLLDCQSENAADTDYLKHLPCVEKAYEGFEPLPLEIKAHAGVEDRMGELENQKHILQQSCMIQHLEDAGMLEGDAGYIEFGCGRAEFSRYVNHALQNKTGKHSSFILIDRAGGRLKCDTKIAQENATVKRYKNDIKDFYLDGIVTNDAPQVVISKHLCGVATDLTIQCLLRSEKLSLKGMCVAMCCRHVCNYAQYAAKDWLAERGIDTEEKFNVLKKIVSWATNGRREGVSEDEVGEHPSGLTYKEREAIGLKARRLIDEGRRQLLEKAGYNARLIRYAEKDVTLENVVMLVTGKKEE